ncbi:uncharacterized protein [Hetaerina americana]|uniref:uncharacterized protein n=1 Tax=Hetaerina americana TaxID=62018 RepID=UPI003A7F24A6
MAGTMRVSSRPFPVPSIILLLLVAFPSAPPECRAALVVPPEGTQTTPPEAGTWAAGGPGSEEGDRRSSPLRVAQCRARCLRRFSGGSRSKDAECMQAPDCFVCWENCELLQSNYAVWGAMCKQKSVCFPGCQQACKFHREEGGGGGEGGGRESGEASRQNVEPVVHTFGHRVVQVVSEAAPKRAGGSRDSPSPTVYVRWPPYSRPPRTDSVVYVVMTKEVDARFWTQVTQTVDLEARLGTSTSAVDRLGIRVLVVDPEGLVTVYSPSTGEVGGPQSSQDPPSPGPGSSPAPPGGERVRGGRDDGSSNSRGARGGEWPMIIREDVTSPLDSAQLALLFPTASAEAMAAGEMSSLSSSPPRPAGSPWVPREVSLIHQRVLVIAEVSWEARGGVYLVTWEVDGGGLKGNLFTQSTSVTLSLWPQTLYHIQVEVVSHTPGDPRPPDRSQVLHLDTRRAAPVVLAPEPQKQEQGSPSPPAGGPSSPLPPPHPSPPSVLGLTADDGSSMAGGLKGEGRRRWAEGEVLAGSGAALALFIAAVLLFLAARWWRGSSSHGRPCPRSPSVTPPSNLPALEEKVGKGMEKEEGSSYESSSRKGVSLASPGHLRPEDAGLNPSETVVNNANIRDEEPTDRGKFI